MAGRMGIAGAAEVAAEATTTGLAVLTEQHRVVWVNRALLRILAVEPASGGEPGAIARSGEVAAGAARAALATSGLDLPELEPDGPARTLVWAPAHGAPRQLEASCRRLRGGDRRRPWSLLLYEIADITVRRERDTRARRREQRLARMVAVARTGSWDWDLITGELRCSDSLVKLLGFPAGTEIDASTYRGFVHPDDLGPMMATVQVALADRGPFTCVHRLVLPDGLPEYVVELHGDVAADERGRPVRVTGIARDVTGEQRAQRELRHLLDHDPLTDLRNRQAVVAHLRAAFAGPGPRPGALLVVGLDHFKDTNDLRGPAVGDQVLRSVAHLLVEQVPEAVIGRLGGDEFAVVLPRGGARAAVDRARDLCAAIARRPVVAGGVALRATASIGVAPLAVADGVDDLLAWADLALREAKSRGRDGARLFTAEQYGGAARRVAAADRVRAALDVGLLTLDARPVAALASAPGNGHELLIRLGDGQEPALGPAEFRVAAERAGLEARLDRWLVGQAVDALAAPAARLRGLRLAIHVSTRSLEDPLFAEHIIDALRTAWVPPGRLAVEITASAPPADPEAAAGVAGQLTAAGCRLILDDFGTGPGSLDHLHRLPFTMVKIDGQLIGAADHIAANAGLVAAVIRAARGLGLPTHHLDRAALAEILARLGVDGARHRPPATPRPLADLLNESEELGEPPTGDDTGRGSGSRPDAPSARRAGPAGTATVPAPRQAPNRTGPIGS